MFCGGIGDKRGWGFRFGSYDDKTGALLHIEILQNFEAKLRQVVKTSTKRSRARVTIGGQWVLLQNSLRMKMFYLFFKYPKLPY